MNIRDLIRIIARLDFSTFAGWEDKTAREKVRAVLTIFDVIAETTETTVDDQLVDVAQRVVESELFDLVLDLVMRYLNRADDPAQVEAMVVAEQPYREEFSAAGIDIAAIAQLVSLVIQFIKLWR